MNNVIKKMLVSEKSFQDINSGKYSFVVDPKASKEEIQQACEDLFKVKVLNINTLNYSGKIKNVRRILGKRADFKKAIVTLKKGDKIELFETENEEKENKKPAKKKTKKEDK